MSERIAVLVSGSGTNLQALIDDPFIRPHLTLVLSDRPGIRALDRAEAAGIPTVVLEPRSYPDRESFDQAILDLFLERDIDACQTELPPLHQFVLPGGTVPGALLHLSRTVARRAERYCVALAREEQIDAQIVRYLNRLSDLCFVLARYVNHRSGKPEHHPTFGKK